MVVLIFSSLKGTSILFSTQAAPIYIPTSSEYLSRCSFAIRMSSLVKYMFRCFAHFSIRLFVFLLLSCESYSHILDTNPLSALSFSLSL